MHNLIFSGSLLDLYNEAKTLSPAESCQKGDSFYVGGRFEESIPFFYSAAERGNSRGLLCIGNAFANGKGIAQNFEEAFDWYEASANSEDHNPFAYYNLGNLYENGLGVQKNLLLAEQNFTSAAERGHREAINRLRSLAYVHENGIGTEINMFRAALIYEKLAALGSTDGLDNFCRLVIVGEGIPDYYERIDITHSLWVEEKLYNNRFFPLALRHNINMSLCYDISNASVKAGNMFFNGIGRNISPIEAICYYINAIEAGEKHVAVNIGKLIYAGLYITRDVDAARKFYNFSQAPDAGILAECIDREIKMADEEISIKFDTISECMQKAQEYKENGHYYLSALCYELAAELGSIDGAMEAAYIYRTPDKWMDLEKVIHYFEQGAESGRIAACIELGMIYEYNICFNGDLDKAMYYYRKAWDIVNTLDKFDTDYLLYKDIVEKHIHNLSVFIKYREPYKKFISGPLRCKIDAVKRLFNIIGEDVEADTIINEKGGWFINFKRNPTSTDQQFIKVPDEQKTAYTPPEGVPDNVDKYFDGIIGMDSVKEQLNKICNSIKVQKKRNELLIQRGITPPENSRRYNFLITGNTGTGKTLVARIIAQILYDIGIRENNALIETDRSGLVGENIGSTPLITKEALSKAKGGVLFIDEAYALYKEDSERDFGREAIDTIVKDMEDNGDTYSVIMAGYKEPLQNMIKNANTGLSSRFTYTIDIPDYTDNELLEIAGEFIKAQHYEADDSVFAAIKKCIIHDRIDETFGNARYIRELINRAIDNMSDRIAAADDLNDEDYFSFRPEDFWQGGKDDKSTKEYLDELNELVGLSSVKKEVNEIITRLEIEAEMEKRGLGISNNIGTLHMTFKGNAGTGKTTVARLLGKLYASLGVIKRNDVFVECSRADLVGMYQGHTAAMVKKVVNSALGGILFIDEAYSLVQGNGDSFGMEALDTLVALMENNRDNLIVIFAGYGDDIDEFLAQNQGLKSRIPIELYFEDYSHDELFSIMKLMIEKKKMKLADTAAFAAKQIITEKAKEADFGNARGIRNLVDSFIRRQNMRVSELIHSGQNVSDETLTTIETEDIG